MTAFDLRLPFCQKALKVQVNSNCAIPASFIPGSKNKAHGNAGMLHGLLVITLVGEMRC